MSATHSRLGPVAPKLRSNRIRRGPHCAIPRRGGDPLAPAHPVDACRIHQPRHPLAPDVHSLCCHLGVNARSTISCARPLVNRLNAQAGSLSARARADPSWAGQLQIRRRTSASLCLSVSPDIANAVSTGVRRYRVVLSPGQQLEEAVVTPLRNAPSLPLSPTHAVLIWQAQNFGPPRQRSKPNMVAAAIELREAAAVAELCGVHPPMVFA